MPEEQDWLNKVKELGSSIVSSAPALGALLSPVTGGTSALIGSGIGILGKMFGLGDKPDPDVLKNAIATDPQSALKLAIADREWQLQMYQAETSRLSIELADIKSAREREIAVKDNVNKVLAYSIIGGFLAMVAGTLLGYAKVDSVLAGTLVGYLSAKAELVLAYYFGSSKSSASKTDMLFRSTPTK